MNLNFEAQVQISSEKHPEVLFSIHLFLEGRFSARLNKLQRRVNDPNVHPSPRIRVESLQEKHDQCMQSDNDNGGRPVCAQSVPDRPRSTGCLDTGRFGPARYGQATTATSKAGPSPISYCGASFGVAVPDVEHGMADGAIHVVVSDIGETQMPLVQVLIILDWMQHNGGDGRNSLELYILRVLHKANILHCNEGVHGQVTSNLD